MAATVARPKPTLSTTDLVRQKAQRLASRSVQAQTIVQYFDGPKVIQTVIHSAWLLALNPIDPDEARIVETFQPLPMEVDLGWTDNLFPTQARVMDACLL